MPLNKMKKIMQGDFEDTTFESLMDMVPTFMLLENHIMYIIYALLFHNYRVRNYMGLTAHEAEFSFS